MANNGQRIGEKTAAGLQADYNQLLQMMTQYLGPAGANLLNLAGGGGLEQFQNIIATLNGLNGQIPGMFDPSKLSQMSPELGDLFKQLTGTPFDRITEILNNQGRTARGDSLFDRFKDIGDTGLPDVVNQSKSWLNSGGYTPDMAKMLETAQGLTGFGGMTAGMMDAQKSAGDVIAGKGRTKETEAAIGEFLKTIQSGGRDAGTNALSAQGQSLISSGGMTPQMTQMFGELQQILKNGGMTGEAKQVFDKSMGLANGQGSSLLSNDQVTSFARDQAATKNVQAMEAARRNAQALTGSSAGAGTTGAAQAESEDAFLRNEASAVQTALTDQQKLKLQEVLTSLGIAGDVTKSATGLVGQATSAGSDLFRSAASNINTGAGMMTDAEKVAAQRFATGTSGFSDVHNVETNRMKSASDLFAAIQQLANSRVNTGLTAGTNIEDLASKNLMAAIDGLYKDSATRLGGYEGAQKIFTTETGNVMQAFNALAGLGGAAGQIATQSQQNNIEAAKAQITAQLTSMGITGDQAKAMVDAMISANKGVTDVANVFGNAANNTQNNYSSIMQSTINAAMQPGFWSKLAQTAVGGLAGGLTGGLGNIIAGKIIPPTAPPKPTGGTK